MKIVFVLFCTHIGVVHAQDLNCLPCFLGREFNSPQVQAYFEYFGAEKESSPYYSFVYEFKIDEVEITYSSRTSTGRYVDDISIYFPGNEKDGAGLQSFLDFYHISQNLEQTLTGNTLGGTWTKKKHKGEPYLSQYLNGGEHNSATISYNKSGDRLKSINLYGVPPGQCSSMDCDYVEEVKAINALIAAEEERKRQKELEISEETETEAVVDLTEEELLAYEEARLKGLKERETEYSNFVSEHLAALKDQINEISARYGEFQEDLGKGFAYSQKPGWEKEHADHYWKAARTLDGIKAQAKKIKRTEDELVAFMKDLRFCEASYPSFTDLRFYADELEILVDEINSGIWGIKEKATFETTKMQHYDEINELYYALHDSLQKGTDVLVKTCSN